MVLALKVSPLLRLPSPHDWPPSLSRLVRVLLMQSLCALLGGSPRGLYQLCRILANPPLSSGCPHLCLGARCMFFGARQLSLSPALHVLDLDASPSLPSLFFDLVGVSP